MELNAGGIISSYNVHAKSPLEPAGENQTQLGGIQSWTHVEFVSPPKSLTKKVQQPIQIDTYIFFVAK